MDENENQNNQVFDSSTNKTSDFNSSFKFNPQNKYQIDSITKRIILGIFKDRIKTFKVDRIKSHGFKINKSIISHFLVIKQIDKILIKINPIMLVPTSTAG